MEPVATGDAIAGPVMEVFVCDDAVDARVVGIGCGVGRCQHILVVEDVEALVLHRTHVEGRDGDDHEDIEVVFAPERLLVPAHGALKRVHREAGARLLSGLDVDAQRDAAPRHGDERILDVAERAADQREQIGRLGKRVVPDREVTGGAGDVPGGRQVAVGEQHRRLGLIGFQARGVDRHYVGPVGEIGDAAKALGLALGAIGITRTIEPGQVRIGGRVDQGLDLEHERALRRLRNAQQVGRRREIIRRQGRAIEPDRRQREGVAVERQRRGTWRGRIGLEPERRAHAGRVRMQRHVEIDGLDQPVRRLIIGEADRLVLVGAHCLPHSGGDASSKPFAPKRQVVCGGGCLRAAGRHCGATA